MAPVLELLQCWSLLVGDSETRSARDQRTLDSPAQQRLMRNGLSYVRSLARRACCAGSCVLSRRDTLAH